MLQLVSRNAAGRALNVLYIFEKSRYFSPLNITVRWHGSSKARLQ